MAHLSVLNIILVLWVLCAGAAAESFSVQISSKIEFYEGKKYAQIYSKGFANVSRAGYPRVLKKVFYIALPQGAENISLTADAEYALHVFAKELIPAQGYKQDRSQIRAVKSGVYLKNMYYPENSVSYTIQYIQGVAFIKCIYFPLQYNPGDKTGRFSESAHFTVSYNQSGKEKILSAKFFRKLHQMSSGIINYSDALRWYTGKNQMSLGTGEFETLNFLYSEGITERQNIDKTIALLKKNKETEQEVLNLIQKYYEIPGDYVIITTRDIKTSAALDDFVKFKSSQGYTIQIVAVEDDIYPFFSGIYQQKIKKYLQASYQFSDMRYVLFVGSRNVIPSALCRTFSYAGEPQQAWSDYYYADLDSDWDSSGNFVFAEHGIDEGIDFIPEVSVGRIPFDSPTDIYMFLMRSQAFEQNNTVKKALLVGALADSQTDGAVLMERMKAGFLVPNGFEVTSLYEKSGMYASLFTPSAMLDRNTLIGALNNQNVLTSWWAHGYSDGSGIVRWISDFDMPVLLKRDDMASVNVSNGTVLFCCSCYNDYGNSSIAASMLQRNSVLTMATTSTAWYRVNWETENDGGSAAMNYEFFKNLTAGMSAGEAANASKIKAIQDYNDEFSQHNVIGFNVLGDPSIRM